MIDWFYSDPVRSGFPTVVTTSYQNILEGTKTVVDTSNRFRVVSDVVCDDFMQFVKPLDAEQLPSRLAPRGASGLPKLGNTRSAQPGAKTMKTMNCHEARRLSEQTWYRASRSSGRRRGGAARREGSCSASRGFTNCIKSSHTTSLTTLKRLEVSKTVLVPTNNFWYDLSPQSGFVLQNRTRQSYEVFVPAYRAGILFPCFL